MEGVKDLEAEALSGDPKAQALLHFLRLLRRKDYAGARAAYEEALAVNPTLEQVEAALKELDRVEQGI